MTSHSLPVLEKCPTGIAGFDDISGGGLPRGRPTLLSGYAGTGKSLFALEFVLYGIESFGEPGVFVSFEELPAELATNVASLGFDLAARQAEGRLRVVSIKPPPRDQTEAGAYDLEGLFLRLGAAIDAVAARRLALDGIENLFSMFSDPYVLRAEFQRLVLWIKERGLTAVITTERGRDLLSRHGLEEYIADCVIALDHRIDSQIATRRLRIVKYRGSAHGSDEYPFVLDEGGFTVIPVTSAGLSYGISTERISTGMPGLDEMLAGGIYRGSGVLVSGTSGTGKSSIAAHLAHAACERGERVLYVAMEESAEQILRNMRSIGIDLEHWRQAGLLRFVAARPTATGLEMHLARMTAEIEKYRPQVVAIDPISAFDIGGNEVAVKMMLLRIVDLFKTRGITGLFTCLTGGGLAEESTAVGVSSLVDVWLLLRNLEAAGERTRGLYVCKARGIAHSNQVREFVLSNAGVRLVDVLLGEDGRILTGSARLLREQQQLAERRLRAGDLERRRAALARRRAALEARIEALRAEFDEAELARESEFERAAISLSDADLALDGMATQRTTPNLNR